MTTTDAIVLVLSIFYLARGCMRGFIASLLFPVAFIGATIVGVIYYQITKDFTVSLLIALIGPFLLNFILKFFLKFFIKASSADTEPNLLSRLGGAAISLAWIWAFIMSTIILLAVFPTTNEFSQKVHNDLMQSIAYKKTVEWSRNFIPLLPQELTNTASTPPTSDLKTLSTDPRFQKVMQDAEVKQEIADHDMVKLMSNPKIMKLTQEIMADPEMMKKVLAAWHNQTKSMQTENPENP